MKHARVLKWVNRIRKEYLGKGPIKRMPKGTQQAAQACPIHNCFWKPRTGHSVCLGSVGMTVDGEEFDLDTPKYVDAFIRNFDAGKYPELIKE